MTSQYQQIEHEVEFVLTFNYNTSSSKKARTYLVLRESINPFKTALTLWPDTSYLWGLNPNVSFSGNKPCSKHSKPAPSKVNNSIKWNFGFVITFYVLQL